VLNSEITATAQCFPGFAEMIYAARERNTSPLASHMFDVYRSWIYVSLCNQVRAGYMLVYVNDVELERARAAVKAVEKKFQVDDPKLDIAQLWKAASEPTSMPVTQDQCQRTLINLLHENPDGAFRIERPI
jgi:hypothetical protein